MTEEIDKFVSGSALLTNLEIGQSDYNNRKSLIFDKSIHIKSHYIQEYYSLSKTVITPKYKIKNNNCYYAY